MTAFWRLSSSRCGRKAHTLISTSKACVHRDTTCVWSQAHTHTHTPILSFFFLPRSLFSFTHPSYSLAFLRWIQKCSQVPLTQRGATWREYLMERKKKKKKELLNISLSTYDQQCVHQRQQNPSVRKIYLIIHQTSEEELPHQQTLWYSEYLMARLVKTRLHFVFWCALTMWDYGDYEERGGGIWRPLLGRRSELTHGKKRSRNDWVLVNIFKFQTSPVKNHRSSYSDIVSLITFE